MNDDPETRKLLLKQGEYRRLYSTILRDHGGALQSSGDGEESRSFEDESSVLNRILRTETRNIAVGIGAAAVTLASLRFARSQRAVSAVFGSAKARMLENAEKEGKKVGTDGFQKSFANVVEGLFSLWAGYRCYDYASQRSGDSLQAIAALPLCKGRSRVSEALCPEWIAATNQQVPAAFWEALDNNQLRTNETNTWEAIRAFSVHCERRLAEEQTVR